MTPQEALQAAIKAVGGVAAELARRIGVTPQALGQWDKVPADRVLAVERATGVSRYILRPDICGDPPADSRPAPASPSDPPPEASVA